MTLLDLARFIRRTPKYSLYQPHNTSHTSKYHIYIYTCIYTFIIIYTYSQSYSCFQKLLQAWVWTCGIQNPFPLRWLPIPMKLPLKNMEFAARCCSCFNSTDACKLNATASHRPLSPRILTIYQGSGLVPAPWGKWAPATVTFNLEARWAKVLRVSIQKNPCVSIGHCKSLMERRGWQNLLSYSFYRGAKSSEKSTQ